MVGVFAGNQTVKDGKDALAVLIDAVEIGAEGALKVAGADPFVGDGAGNVDVLAKGVEGVAAQEKSIKERGLALGGQRIVVVSRTHSDRKDILAMKTGVDQVASGGDGRGEMAPNTETVPAVCQVPAKKRQTTQAGRLPHRNSLLDSGVYGRCHTAAKVKKQDAQALYAVINLHSHMPSFGLRLRRNLIALHRRTREWRMLAKGLMSTSHPVLAHIVPTRRCNLACTYCNEFDDFSKPVPVEEMIRRIDHLADLGTSIVSFSGGEPLLHPELDDLIAHIRRRGAIAGMITNGYLLTADRIQRLNRAGLEHMQISIDNVKPDEVSKKSLKVLDKKLQLLAEHADFHVNINSVVGGGIHHPHDAIEVAKRAVALGFTSTVGIIHDSDRAAAAADAMTSSIFSCRCATWARRTMRA